MLACNILPKKVGPAIGMRTDKGLEALPVKGWLVVDVDTCNQMHPRIKQQLTLNRVEQDLRQLS